VTIGERMQAWIGGRGSVRRALFGMVLSLILPTILILLLLSTAAYREARLQYDRQLIGVTRALALATDRSIDAGEALAQALAASPALTSGDLETFESLARAATPNRDTWIVLSDQRGQLINTRLPRGRRLRDAPYPPARWAEVQADRNALSNLFRGPASGALIFAIDRPVRVNGQPMALAVIQHPRVLDPLFRDQRVPEPWAAAVLDRNGVVVARSKEGEQFRGKLARDDVRRALSRQDEGVIPSQSLDGTPTYAAFSRSPRTGWTFVVGVPRTEVEGDGLRAALALAALASLLLAAGMTAAFLWSRRIQVEVHALAEDAAGLGSGRPVPAPNAELDEIAEVRAALSRASTELTAREAEAEAAAERQRLMINELNHRVKNSLATVQSLAHHSLTDRRSTSAVAFQERLQALSRAHDLLTRQVWESADLGDVVAQAVRPWASQVDIQGGPPAQLEPAVALALSMMLHELGTNALKYGALGADEGRVSIGWCKEDGRLRLTWREQGGPPPTPPKREGFGSRLLQQSARMELRGSAELRYDTTGVVCDIRIGRWRVPDESVS